MDPKPHSDCLDSIVSGYQLLHIHFIHSIRLARLRTVDCSRNIGPRRQVLELCSQGSAPIVGLELVMVYTNLLVSSRAVQCQAELTGAKPNFGTNN